ncbi:O-methyltransferase [Seiridium cupressi]
MSGSRSLIDLGDLIQSCTKSIHDVLSQSQLPQPTFSSTTPSDINILHGTIQDNRAKLLEALEELRTLVLGPTSYIFHTAVLNPSWVATFAVLYTYRIAQHVPADGTISYAELSERCGLPTSDIKRILRAAISIHIFQEERSDFVKHNANSAILKTALGHDALGFFTEEYTSAALKLPESLRRFPASDNVGESAAAIANGDGGDQDIFALISHDPERVARLANAHSFVATVPETSLAHFVEHVPWSTKRGSIKCPQVVVDIGGSHGSLCKGLLREYPGIEKAIVEDLPEVIEKKAHRPTEENFEGRLEYQHYNFFTEQVVKGADVYIFRTVLHDWPDSAAVQILKNQIPALKLGSTILINDICGQEASAGTSPIHQAQYAYDLFVKMGVNAKERTQEDWTKLLADADRGFKLASIVTPAHCVHSIIEVVWQGDTETG